MHKLQQDTAALVTAIETRNSLEIALDQCYSDISLQEGLRSSLAVSYFSAHLHTRGEN